MNKINITRAYQKGYQKALRDINTPRKVIQKEWNPSECPRCQKNYSAYEECHDGYYKRVYSLERCPYWSKARMVGDEYEKL